MAHGLLKSPMVSPLYKSLLFQILFCSESFSKSKIQTKLVSINLESPAMAAALRRLSNNIIGHLSQPNYRNTTGTALSSSPSWASPALLISRRGIAYKLFIGGLSFYTTENGLSEAFSQFGQVVEAKIPMDRVSGRSKGFGFITYASEDEAENAIKGLNGKPLNGRVIFVDYAKPRTGFDGGLPIARGPPEPSSDQ